MKTQTIFVLLFLGNILLQPIMAQTNRVTTTRTTGTTVENGVTMMVTQETTTRYRRTTSQGVPDAKLGYTPGETPMDLALPLAETVMARYPDYRLAYWKDYTYVQGYMFEAMDRLGQLTGNPDYLEYIRKYIDYFVDDDGNYKGGGLTNLDNFMTGSAFCTLYARTGNEKYKKAALQILKAVDDYPSSDGQFWHGNRSPNMWIDGVFMMQMFLIRCGQLWERLIIAIIRLAVMLLLLHVIFNVQTDWCYMHGPQNRKKLPGLINRQACRLKFGAKVWGGTHWWFPNYLPCYRKLIRIIIKYSIYI